MKKTKLYYVGSKGVNFGDSINPKVFERIFDIPVTRGYPTFADVVGIGSILQNTTFESCIRRNKFLYFYRYSFKPIITIGTGFMRENLNDNPIQNTFRKIHPLVLRGKLTHKNLEKITHKKYENVSYGDLGLIFPYLLGDKMPSKKYKLGIIPHMRDYNNPVISRLKEYNDNSVVIWVENDPLEVMKQIAECETIISSSLHGLIAADSMGIPNKWFKLSYHGHTFLDPDKDFAFKFRDYYSIFDIENPVCIDLRQIEKEKENFELLKPEKITDEYSINLEEVKKYQVQLLSKGKELKEILQNR